MTKYQEILKELKEGITYYGNKNTGFRNRDGEMWMVEYSRDCKNTQFFSVEKFARRINRFFKTGY